MNVQRPASNLRRSVFSAAERLTGLERHSGAACQLHATRRVWPNTSCSTLSAVICFVHAENATQLVVDVENAH
jgi:hypothetical protein